MFGKTGTKTDSRFEFIGAEPFTAYYFVILTRTEAHGYNKNILESEYSREVFASTEGNEKIISGKVETESYLTPEGVDIIFTPPSQSCKTDASGCYRYAVEPGWSGTIEPSSSIYTFEPANHKVDNVTVHRRDLNFTATLNSNDISGHILSGSEGIPGVTMTFTSESGETWTEFTDSYGYYKKDVPFGWTGRLTPSKENLILTPPYIDYYSVTEELKEQAFRLSISMNLDISREEDNTVIVGKDYAIIRASVDIAANLSSTAKKFILLRKDPHGTIRVIYEYTVHEVKPVFVFNHEDKYIDKDKSYIYMAQALDAEGNVIGEAKEKTI